MRVLHVIHDFLPRHLAGSEIYAYDLCRYQHRQGHQVHVLCAEYDAARPHGSLTWRWHNGLPVTELVNNWHFSSFAETYESERINRQLEHVLSMVQPDLLHIHNLLNLSMDLPALARGRRIPSVATLHDFTLLCPSGGQRVHQAEKHVCLEIDRSRCARCFPQSHFYRQMVFAGLSRRTAGMKLGARLGGWVRRGWPRLFARLGQAAARHSQGPALGASDIERRLAKVRQVFANVDLFVAPSRALASDYQSFGLEAAKIRVSDYGFPPLEARPRPVSRDPHKLRIGFVGTLTWHKGAHVLMAAASRLPPDRFELRLFGSVDTFPDYTASLRHQAQGLPVRFMGGFQRQEAAGVYADMDVLVVASLWPENSPLVIHEAFMAGVPVVGSRIGGTVDLVRDGENGLLYDAFSAEDLAAKLRSLLEDPGRLDGFARSLPQVKTLAQDAAEWDEIYRQVVEGFHTQGSQAAHSGPGQAMPAVAQRQSVETQP